MNKPTSYEHYFNFGRPEKKILSYVISNKPILPESLIGKYIKKCDGYYLSKTEFINCLKETNGNLSMFIEQINSKKETFNFKDFDELLYGKVVPLHEVLLTSENE